MDIILILFLPFILAQVEAITWGHIVEILKPVIIALAVLLGTKYLTPSINRTDDLIKRSEERAENRFKALEERMLRAEKERDDLRKEVNELWKRFNELNNEHTKIGEKQFNLSKYAASIQTSCERTTDMLKERIDDFRAMLLK